MQANWKLIIFDVLVLLHMGLIFYGWNAIDNLHRFLWLVFGLMWLARQVYEHVSFYKKQRRLF